MKKIAVGDLGEFWYGDYKEPFVQLEGAVTGYPRGVLLKADDGKLLCPFCGKTYDSLGKHTSAHGLTARTFKEEVGLLQKSALVSEQRRLDQIRGGLLRVASDPGLSVLRARRTGFNMGAPTGHLAGAVEKQNKTGRCYEQLKAVGQSLMRQKGRVTMKDLAALGISQGVIEARFGSLAAFQRLVGYQNAKRYRFDRAELLDMLRTLADSLGRTPAASDMRRHGLPSESPFRRAFGSWSAAKDAAGLPPVRLPVEGSEAQMLMAYAVTGDLQKTARATNRSTPVIKRTLLRYGVVPLPAASHVDRQAMRDFAAEMAQRLSGPLPEDTAVA